MTKKLTVVKKSLACTLLLILSLAFSVTLAQAQPSSEQDKQQTFLYYQKAMQAFKNEDYPACVQICREAIGADSADKNTFHLQALALAECGENYKALQSFREALTMDYTFIQCRNNMGRFQFKLGDLAAAKMTFQECIKINPKYPPAHYNLGQILQKQGDLDGAIEEYEVATNLDPNYFEAQRDLGLAIYEKASSGLTDIADCEDKLKIAEKLAPKNPMIHQHLANIYCAAGKLDQAETEFKMALALDNQLGAAHYELGRLRYFRGDLDRCLAEVNLALKVKPIYTESKSYPAVDICQAKLLMAKCYEFKGNIKQAISYWQDVAAMEKENKDLLKHISKMGKQKSSYDRQREKADCQSETAQSLLIKGIMQTDSGELDAAKSTFENMARDYPGCFESWQNHGALEEITGNLQSAMADYKKALELCPQYDGLYYNQSYVLEKMGLTAEAGAMYKQFHDIAGKYPYDSKHIVALEQEYARQQAKYHK